MFVLTKQQSIANELMRELRDVALQQDRLRFRTNMEKLGEILAYEVSKTLEYSPRQTVTPLGTIGIDCLVEQPVLITILRAGIPFFNGFLNIFNHADCGFIGAYRKEDENHLTIKLEYVATNPLEGRIVIIIDPMLATGRSVIDTVNAIQRNGRPRHLHVCSLVAAPQGVEYLKKNLQSSYSLWTCSLDEGLNEQLYIVPGLGDAGDLSFGVKL